MVRNGVWTRMHHTCSGDVGIIGSLRLSKVDSQLWFHYTWQRANQWIASPFSDSYSGTHSINGFSAHALLTVFGCRTYLILIHHQSKRTGYFPGSRSCTYYRSMSSSNIACVRTSFDSCTTLGRSETLYLKND